jgi:aminocarboxymuconate-semialdehyde decarboxylase
LAFHRNALQFQPVKIDLHTHILPREWPDLDSKYGYGGFVRLDHHKPCCARMMVGGRVFRKKKQKLCVPTPPKQKNEDAGQ